MEETIRLLDIKQTGYKTWTDFYFSITSFGEQNGVYSYDYLNSEKKNDTITFRLSQRILQELVLEEAKKTLKIINPNSFTDLLENKMNNLTQERNFDFDVIINDSSGEIYFRKISIGFDRIVVLSNLEKNVKHCTVYEAAK